MELDLAADAAQVAGLSRLKALAACRDGRIRSHAVKLVWHDTPERSLLADGMALAEHRGAWHMERLVPGLDTWLPAQPAPVMAETADPATLPGPLAPLAAFEGREATGVYRFGDEAVAIAVTSGSVRTVTESRPTARIRLSGEENAVAAAMRLIAGAIPVRVPAATLAGEAIALATGSPPIPRRRGAPSLPPGTETTTDAFAHILGHLTDVLVSLVPKATHEDDTSIESVHQMRVAVRRARSALSIFRSAVPDGALATVTTALRDINQRLGPVRDWDVFIAETAPRLRGAMPDDERLDKLIGGAERKRAEFRHELAGYLDSPAFRLATLELAWFANAEFWRSQPAPLLAFASGVLAQRWKKLHAAGRHIEDLDIAGLHGVRLRAKRIRYAAEMFQALYRGKAADKFIRRLSRLQEALGVLNDGHIAGVLMLQLGGATGRHAYAAGLVNGFMAARAARIRPKIFKSFEELRNVSPYWS